MLGSFITKEEDTMRLIAGIAAIARALQLLLYVRYC